MTDHDWHNMEAFRQREIRPLIRAGRYGDAIGVLRRRLGTETKKSRRLYLLRDLAYLLTVDGRADESLSAIQHMIGIDPDDPLNWARLSGWYFWDRGNYHAHADTLASAFDAIEEAVKRGRRRDRHNLRQCLLDRCRIVVAMKRWDLLEESLREILENWKEPGIQFEDDFLHRVPEDAVDGKLMATYKDLLAHQAEVRKKKRSRTT